jgi:PKD domain
VPDPPPVVTVDAGGLAVLGVFNGSGSFTDSNLAGHTFTATVNYGDGSGAHPLTLNGTTFTLAHTYGPLRTYTVTVTVTDDQGVSGSGTTTVTAVL